MRPESEAQPVLLELAVHVEDVRVGEDVGVSVSRQIGGDDAFAGLDVLFRALVRPPHLGSAIRG